MEEQDFAQVMLHPPEELSDLSELEMLNHDDNEKSTNAVVKNAWEQGKPKTMLDQISERSDEAGSSNRGGSFT